MTAAPVKVVFIEGAGRSGTTILDTILGQLDGFFSTGELRYIWDRNVIEDNLCGCGLAFSDCRVWQQVLGLAFEGAEPNAEDIVRLRDQAVRLRQLPLSLTARGRARIRAQAEDYLTILGRLYHAIARVSGADIIVDSSKMPTHGYLLRLVPGVEVVTVHVIRDPRAVVYSWLRPKLDWLRPGQSSPMAQYALLTAARAWLSWNVLSEGLGRRARGSTLQVRYEDFVAHPRTVIADITRLLGRDPDLTPFVGAHAVQLEATHTVGGNPDRYRTGTVELRSDDAWRMRLPRRERALVTTICWPLMRRYGYLRPAPDASS